MKSKSFISLLLAVIMTTMLLYSGGYCKAEAAGTIRAVPNDVMAGSDEDLGLLIFEIPEGALKAGDAFIMTLPNDFYFNNNVPPAVGNDINNLVPSTVNVVYPPMVAGDANSITGNLTADYPGQDKVKITLTADTDITKKSFLYVYLKGVTVPSGYEGDIQINITSNSGWPTSIEGMGDVEYNDGDQEKNDGEIKEPGNKEQTLPPVMVQSIFKIGEMSFTMNSDVIAMDVAPFIKNGRTYVPVRYVAKAAGVPDESISYESGIVTIKSAYNTITLKPGSDVLFSEGKHIKMDAPVLLENGRTYLPLRWVCEALKLKVTWIEENQSVIIQN